MADEDHEDDSHEGRLRVALIEMVLNEESMTNTSPDELVIIQRGPKRLPLTWSPLDYETGSKRNLPKEMTASSSNNDLYKKIIVTPTRLTEISSKLRRRLILSPSKFRPQMAESVAKKFKSLYELNSPQN